MTVTFTQKFTINATSIFAAITTLIGQGACCDPDFFTPDVVQFSVCGTANAPGTDPAPLIDFLQNHLFCQNLINTANPLTGTLSGHHCSLGFETINDVAGFTVNSIELDPICPPRSKGCLRRVRRGGAAIPVSDKSLES
ncbi:hypothetical protein DM02DRAFT_660048 [Periconia macrospinosa]|uniref:Uncharacterized protein n=1 Tax=Periconia macrospinosa TaxID=97972 RepID=A0A2V1DBT8_9PLEO|nr:hypothetical protein DM02DRAFT_660048 [Periconia macrospinosa]